MSLVKVQNLLAHLYTDSKLREDFFIDPSLIARQFDLNEIEIEKATRLAQLQVDGFSHSLIQKRLNEVKKKLTLTSQVLGQQFNHLFYQFAQNEQCKGTQKYLEDCYQFSEFIVSVAHREDIKSWVIDLLRYEIIRMKAVCSKFGFRFYFSRYGIKDLMIEMMHNTSPPIDARRRITVGLWVRAFKNKKLWHRLY